MIITRVTHLHYNKKINNKKYCNDNMSEAILKKKNKEYKIFTERRVITYNKDKELYDLFVKYSVSATLLYNYLNHIQRAYFFNSKKTAHISYKELLSYIEYKASYKGDTYLHHIYNELLPLSIRKGIINDVCSKWYKFINYKTTNIPKHRRGSNRRTSFTINGNSITLTKDHKLRLSNDLNNITIPIRTKDLFSSKSIIEIRVTPYHNRFNLDIKYVVKYGNPEKRYRVAGIDIGVDNLIAMATNVGSSPILIKGGRVTSVNKKYNNLLRNKKLNSNSYNKLNKNRINFIKNYFNHCANIIVDYLSLSSIRKLYIGYNSKGIKSGFINHDNIFLPIDYDYLVNQIKKKCYKYNIEVKLITEYYTSTCCALDSDTIDKLHSKPNKRISNRLYKSKTFGIISADVNSAFNMIRKGYDGFIGNILEYITKKVLSNASNCRERYRRLMVSPLVISDALHFNITNNLIHPKGVYVDLWNEREMQLNQIAKPFYDRETLIGEVSRMKILIPK